MPASALNGIIMSSLTDAKTNLDKTQEKLALMIQDVKTIEGLKRVPELLVEITGLMDIANRQIKNGTNSYVQSVMGTGGIFERLSSLMFKPNDTKCNDDSDDCDSSDDDYGDSICDSKDLTHRGRRACRKGKTVVNEDTGREIMRGRDTHLTMCVDDKHGKHCSDFKDRTLKRHRRRQTRNNG